MEPCNDKHINSRFINLYIYTIIRMCHHCNDEHYDRYECNTNFYPDRTIVPERSTTGTSYNIQQ